MKLHEVITKVAMEKTALTAQKARALARSVGLEAHPDSQWKWALRKMRAANPTGAKGAPLMQSGRELAETKENVIGLLPNNVRQKMKAESRKQRQGVEVGYTRGGRHVTGYVGGIEVDPADPIIGHVHPEGDKTILRSMLKKQQSYRKGNPYGYSRFSVLSDKHHVNPNLVTDKVMGAELSGASNIYKGKNTPKPYSTDIIRRSKSDLKEYDLQDKVIEKKYLGRYKGLWGKATMAVEGRGPYPTKVDRQYAKYEDARGEIIRKYSPSRATKRIEHLKAYTDPYTGSGADVHAIKKHTPNEPHTIMAKDVTGVHKKRKYLPKGMRSVYFKGGLD